MSVAAYHQRRADCVAGDVGYAGGHAQGFLDACVGVELACAPLCGVAALDLLILDRGLGYDFLDVGGGEPGVGLEPQCDGARSQRGAIEVPCEGPQ